MKQFEVYRQIDVLRFLQVMEENDATLVAVVIIGERFYSSKYLILYNHPIDLEMEVHT